MKQQNQYDYLKIDCLEDTQPVDATASWHVTDSKQETIIITGALLPDGYWVYGYTVYWAKGGSSSTRPSAAFGKFRTLRESRLHAIGFMNIYLPYFIQDTRDALRIAETSLLQGQLFD